MRSNNSPWLHELQRARPVVPLSESIATEVLIVGGGIAGIMTAYHILKDTDKKVVLIDAGKVAHGASGHNAGQITSYFERSLHSIEREFGSRMALEGEAAHQHAWKLLDAIVEEVRPKTAIYRFTGHTGLSTAEQVLSHFRDSLVRARAGRDPELLYIRRDAPFLTSIPSDFNDLYRLAEADDISSLLETDNKEFVAVYSTLKGCTNSARLVEEVAGYLLKVYADRFSLYEESFMSKVVLKQNEGIAHVGKHTIHASRIVLCTNGFEAFAIENSAGVAINSSFHHSIKGYIGYMSGYREKVLRDPMAISFFRSNEFKDNITSTYFYLTRRPFDDATGDPGNLISVGGPGRELEFKEPYNAHEALDDSYRYHIDAFLKENYKHTPDDEVDYEFNWHGLMGYTPNALRRIGPEPCNPVLLYNLGCNGVGILLSIYGGEKIAKHINNERLPQTIFDPVDQRCMLEPTLDDHVKNLHSRKSSR